MCRKSHQANHLLFKYYISKLRGGVSRLALTMLTQGVWEVQNLGNPPDVILEHSLQAMFLYYNLALV